VCVGVCAFDVSCIINEDFASCLANASLQICKHRRTTQAARDSFTAVPLSSGKIAVAVVTATTTTTVSFYSICSMQLAVW